MRSVFLGFPILLGAIALMGTSPAVGLPSRLPAVPACEPLRFAMLPTFGAVATAVPQNVATDLARRIHRIEKLTGRLSVDEGFLRSADDGTLLLLFNRTEGKAELLRSYAPSFGAAAVPEDLFQYLDLALDGLWQEIARLAPTYTQSTGHPLMQALSTALERRLRTAVPKATYVGGMLREKEWRTRRSALGVPESRSVGGMLFYRIPDQPWLICREFEVTQKYFDRSREEKDVPGEITLGCMRLQA